MDVSFISGLDIWILGLSLRLIYIYVYIYKYRHIYISGFTVKVLLDI